MLNRYMRQVKRYALLTQEETTALAHRAFAGDREAQHKLVVSNLRYVAKLAMERYKNSRASMLDLIQEGNLGLMDAAAKFNPNLGTYFLAYAKQWILARFARYVDRHTRVVSIKTTPTILGRIRRASGTDEEVARELGLLHETVQFARAGVDAPLDNVTLFSRNRPDQVVLSNEVRAQISEALKLCTATQRNALVRYAVEGCTLDEIGEETGVSKQAVNQAKRNAAKHLRVVLGDLE